MGAVALSIVDNSNLHPFARARGLDGADGAEREPILPLAACGANVIRV
jgi:hypothetical protein